MGNGAAGNTPPTVLEMWFGNNNPVGNISVSCTLLTGRYGFLQYSVTKTASVIPGGRNAISWGPGDNPTPGATSLGDYFIGVTCILPTRGVMADTYLNWVQDNGV
jgi:hypothetical protein